MAFFRCLKSNKTVNYDTGADLGSTTTSTFFIPNTPIDYNSVTGLIFLGGSNIQSFIATEDGTLTLTDLNDGTGIKVTDGSVQLYTGKMELTWSAPPGANSALISFTGGPIFKYVTSRLFTVSCPKLNTLCSNRSSAFVAAVTICNQNLYV